MTEKKRFEEPKLVKYEERLDDVTRTNHLGSPGNNNSFLKKSWKLRGRKSYD